MKTIQNLDAENWRFELRACEGQVLITFAHNYDRLDQHLDKVKSELFNLK